MELKKSNTNEYIKAAILVPLSLGILLGGFYILSNLRLGQIATTLLAIIWGAGAVILFFYMLNVVIQLFKANVYNALVPFVFVGPAVIIMGWYLLSPAVQTTFLSFMDKKSVLFVGLKNYIYVFSDKTMLISIGNTVTWLVIGTSFSVLIGLIVAVLADRSSIEKTGKVLVFLPMAISLVGAGLIWKFVYAYRPSGASQIGILNAIVTSFGDKPVNWLGTAPMNTVFLIVIFIWLQTGFALVVLSAALKAVPHDMIEAARIDGAGEFKILLQIIIPSIKGSIITVTTTILLAALKSFDIVYSMTNGLFGTEVLASQQYKQMFKFMDYGRGSAIAVVILLAVSPVIYYNLRGFNRREVF